MIWVPGRRAAPLLALAAGALAAVAHPPFGFLPGLLGYALLLHLVDQAPDQRPLRSAFWRGWLAGLGYFLIGCWWISEAFMVDAAAQGWMAPFAVGLTAAGLALFWGAACALYRWLRPAGLWRILAFAGFLTGFEWLRGNILTGFPWNLPGETWAAGSAPSQAASVVGAYGLTWITLAIAAAFAAPFAGLPRRQVIGATAAAGAVLVGLYVFGALRLASSVDTAPGAPLVRIVQANVGQEKKYDEASFRAILWKYLTLTARPGARTPDIVIWPEGALPDLANSFLAPGAWTTGLIADTLRPGQTLMLGAARAEGVQASPAYYNSLIALRRDAAGTRVVAVYDKHHLVPFGEYLPFQALLQPLGFRKLTHIGDSFATGPAPAPLTAEGIAPVQPLICYEVLFPELVRRSVNRGAVHPSWIVNVSNDAWFGATSGPLQHLNIASYRSVELGLPMVRATPTGVSAVVDAFGRSAPATRLGLGRMGVVDAQLPPALQSTVYRRLGDLPLCIFLVVSLLSLTRKPRISRTIGVDSLALTRLRKAIFSSRGR